MSVRSASTRLVISLAAGGLLLVGCGSSNLSAMLDQGSTSTGAVIPAPAGETDSGSGAGAGAGAGAVGGGLGILSSDCMGVVSAYTSIAMALVPSLGGGGTYDSGQVATAISGLGGKVPAALQPDFDTLNSAAKQASGKSMEQAGAILGTDAVSKASDDISNWMDKNCGT